MSVLKKWNSCVKKFDGKKIQIVKKSNGINTNGKVGNILSFDYSAGKYEVSFNNGYSGWYLFSEFKFI